MIDEDKLSTIRPAQWIYPLLVLYQNLRVVLFDHFLVKTLTLTLLTERAMNSKTLFIVMIPIYICDMQIKCEWGSMAIKRELTVEWKRLIVDLGVVYFYVVMMIDDDTGVSYSSCGQKEPTNTQIYWRRLKQYQQCSSVVVVAALLKSKGNCIYCGGGELVSEGELQVLATL